MELVVRDLPAEHREVAVAVLADAFADEPYVVDLHGADRAARLAAVHARYAGEDPAERTLRLAAYADGALVGVLLGSLPGTCHACRLGSPTAEPWTAAVAQHHADAAVHGWAGRVGVAAAYRGRSVGSALLATAAARIGEAGAVTMLECQSHRIGYYERRGFVVVARVPDPPGDDGAVLSLEPSAGSR